ncbi:MAG: DUF2231 domain-containing protein [Balneolaceae bacterium]
MNFIPEWAPSIHPMIVHFPIAILLLAVIMDVASLFLPKSWWDEKKNLILYAFASVSSVGAFLSGNDAAEKVFVEADAQRLLTNHADWAEYTVWFLAIYTLLRIGAFVWKKAEIKSIQVGFTILAFAGVFLVYKTAELGAEMVFGHGVGVQQTESSISEPTANDEKAESKLFETEEGWRWEIGENPNAEFQENFHWLKGSAESNNLQPEQLSENNQAISFSGDDLNGFFTSHENYQNVQVDYYLDISAFEGEIILANHVKDQNNYDFVSIQSDGTLKQGRISEGAAEIFEEGSADFSEPVFIRVVIDKTHFWGYVDKNAIVHGHSSAPGAGSVGMAFKGSGKIILDKIEMTTLE